MINYFAKTQKNRTTLKVIRLLLSLLDLNQGPSD